MSTLLFGVSTITWIGIALGGLILAAFLRFKFGGMPMTETLELPAPDDPSGVNRTKVYVQQKGFRFQPFRPKGKGTPLSKAGLLKDEELLSVERGGERHLYTARQMTYHHIAQSTLAGEPYVVSF